MAKNIIELQNSTQEFFDKATHELKTPLTAIKGYSQLLQDEIFEDDFINKSLKRMKLESIKMEKLVENLLYVSREKIEYLENKEKINLESLLEEIIKNYRLNIENKKIHLDIEKNANDEVMELFVLKEDLEIILNNLIGNSFKYTVNGKVKIILTHTTFNIENKYNPDNINFDGNLLEPFVKGRLVDHNISSSGLGLYICKKICLRNGWIINYEILKEYRIIRFTINFK